MMDLFNLSKGKHTLRFGELLEGDLLDCEGVVGDDSPLDIASDGE